MMYATTILMIAHFQLQYEAQVHKSNANEKIHVSFISDMLQQKYLKFFTPTLNIYLYAPYGNFSK